MSKCFSGSSSLSKYYCTKPKGEQILYLTFKEQQIFSKAKFSKYLTSCSYSTYLHETVSIFPVIFSKLTILSIEYEENFYFFVDILPSASFTGKYLLL